MNEDKKTERRREIIAVCLDCFVEKGLTITTTKDLCTAAKLQNGGIYYYFSTKEEIVLACAEAAIERIEKGAFGIVFEDIQDVKSMMDRLGALADKMSPTMRFRCWPPTWAAPRMRSSSASGRSDTVTTTTRSSARCGRSSRTVRSSPPSTRAPARISRPHPGSTRVRPGTTPSTSRTTSRGW